MTDEDIIELAEKTRKEKFCPQYRECLYEHRDDIYDCSCRCPVSYADEFDIQCGDTIYETGFLDGFKEAMEYFNQIIKKLNTDGKFDDEFNYSGGYQRAFEDIQEELGM